MLVHLHAEQPDRFAGEVEALLAEPGIRFHVKEVVLALLRGLERPTHAERLVIERQIAENSALRERLWSTLRTPAWFDRLHEEGLLAAWLGGDDEELRNRALDVILSGTKDRPARVAELLAEVRHEPFYPMAVKGLSFYTDLDQSREMLDLVLDVVRDGYFNDAPHDLFMSAHALGVDQPRWACDLLTAWFVDRPDALALNDEGKIQALDNRDHGAGEIISAAASNAPGEFAAVFVP